jgi:hypothetical protein
MPRPHFTPGERTPGTHCTGGWVGPRAGLDTEARGKILCLRRDRSPVVQSIVRHYTDWASPSPLINCIHYISCSGLWWFIIYHQIKIFFTVAMLFSFNYFNNSCTFFNNLHPTELWHPTLHTFSVIHFNDTHVVPTSHSPHVAIFDDMESNYQDEVTTNGMLLILDSKNKISQYS